MICRSPDARLPAVFCLILVVGGCSLFGTGPEDARLFLARFDTAYLDLDHDFPSDPHSLSGYAIADASDISHPSIIGSGFNTRNEFNAIVLDNQYTGEISVFRFRNRGNPYAGRRMDYDIGGDPSVSMNDAFLTTSGTLVGVGQTRRLTDSVGRDRRDFLVISTDATGLRLTSFGTDGRVETGFPAVTASGTIPTNSFATHGVATAAGSFYAVGGRTDDLARNDAKVIAIARYTDSGALDSSFSRDGKSVSVPVGARRLSVSAVAATPGGGLLIAGSATYGDGSTRHLLSRHLATGLLDRSFGTGGWLLFGRDTDSQHIVAIAAMSGYALVLYNTGELQAIQDDGTDYRRFGMPVPGTGGRTGFVAVPGAAVSLLATSDEIYTLDIRSERTYLTQYSALGDKIRDTTVGIVTPLFPDSDFIGAELAIDGAYVYVVGLVK